MILYITVLVLHLCIDAFWTLSLLVGRLVSRSIEYWYRDWSNFACVLMLSRFVLRDRSNVAASTGSVSNSNSNPHLYLLVNGTVPLLPRRPYQFEIQIQNSDRTSVYTVNAWVVKSYQHASDVAWVLYCSCLNNTSYNSTSTYSYRVFVSNWTLVEYCIACIDVSWCSFKNRDKNSNYGTAFCQQEVNIGCLVRPTIRLWW